MRQKTIEKIGKPFEGLTEDEFYGIDGQGTSGNTAVSSIFIMVWGDCAWCYYY